MINSQLFGTAPCGTSVHRYTLNGPDNLRSHYG